MLVLCDPRLTRKSYGQVFLDSLPPFPLTRDVGEVQGFFARGAGDDHTPARVPDKGLP